MLAIDQELSMWSDHIFHSWHPGQNPWLQLEADCQMAVSHVLITARYIQL